MKIFIIAIVASLAGESQRFYSRNSKILAVAVMVDISNIIIIR